MILPTDPNFENKKTDSKKQKNVVDPRLVALYQKLNTVRPAFEIILDEDEVLLYMNFSIRKLQGLRDHRLIGYAQPIPNGMVHYTFQDILDYYASGRKPAIQSQRKF